MRAISIAFAISALLLAGGCREETTTTSAPETTQVTEGAEANLTPEELGALGAEIGKNPNDAQRLLTARGLNEDSFETAIRKVAEDPEASKRYTEAYKRASA